MVFHRKQKHINELNTAINGARIDLVESFNFLGITIDENLSWNHHVDIVKKKNIQSNWNSLSTKEYFSSGDLGNFV